MLNTADLPLLLLEGQLLEGGMQHRMVARTVLLAPGTEERLAVVCVEEGRWSGTGEHRVSGRRASIRVRGGLRSADGQGEVWRRVRRYDSERGRSATSSYLDHADRSERIIDDLVSGLRPFPGQVGVLIGLAGQPLVAEVFDTPESLGRHFDAIVRAAAMDAVGLPPSATPGRRARRFLDRAGLVRTCPTEHAGIGLGGTGRSEHVEATALLWGGHAIHTLLTNPHHELLLAA